MAKLAVLPSFVSSVAIELLYCILPISTRNGFISAMKTAKIVLKELVFFARHGLLEEEAKLGQRFHLDVVVELEVCDPERLPLGLRECNLRLERLRQLVVVELDASHWGQQANFPPSEPRGLGLLMNI